MNWNFDRTLSGPFPRARTRRMLLKALRQERNALLDALDQKGDRPGHPFRGNQWTRVSAPANDTGSGALLPTGKMVRRSGEKFEEMPHSLAYEDHSPEMQGYIYSELEKLGVPDFETCVGNLVERMEAAALTGSYFRGEKTTALDAGERWYDEEGDGVAEWGESLGLSRAQAVGMVAATSSNNTWEYANGNRPNEDCAMRIAKAVADDIEITITDEDVSYWTGQTMRVKTDSKGKPTGEAFCGRGRVKEGEIKAGTYRMSELPADIAARVGNAHGNVLAGNGGATGWSNVSKAIEIARGARPADVLTGDKVRNFYGALHSGGKGDFPVVDRWMIGAAAGFTSKSQIKPVQDTLTKERVGKRAGGPTPLAKGGTYSFFASAMVEAGRRFNEKHGTTLTVPQTQAIAWYAIKDGPHPKRVRASAVAENGEGVA